MISAVCILLPFVLAAALPYVPHGRWLSLGCAAVDLALAISLPWTGDGLGGWLLPDPLAVHVAVLTGFAWLMASAAESAPPSIAILVGALNLALFSDAAGLSVMAAGGAGVAAVLSLRLKAPGPMLSLVALGTGLAMLGATVLYSGTAPVLGQGWAALSWSALPEAGGGVNGPALSVGFVLILLGSGITCILLPIWTALTNADLPRPVAMLAGPLGGLWLVIVLRLRGVLNGNGHAIAPGGVLFAAGLAGLGLAALCLWRRSGQHQAALLGVFGAVLIGFGVGGAAATAAGLVHLALGCIALTAAATGSRLGLASLAGIPPLGLFASGFVLMTDVAVRSGWAAASLGLGLFAVAALALANLPTPAESRLGWVGVVLALAGAWAMPPFLAAWIQGIAATAR